MRWSTSFGIVAWSVLIALSAVVGGALPAAATPAPCGGLNTVPITNSAPGGQIYCESSFGWSDSWFPTSNTVSGYTESLDVFSGNDAPGLIWSDMPENSPNGNPNYNVFTPTLDENPATAGTIQSNSPWSVTSDLNPSGNTGTSTIQDGPIQVEIVTSVNTGGQVTFTFTITNTYSPSSNEPAITGLELFDYFNFHPYGSGTGGGNNSYNCATTSFDSATETLNTVGTASCVNSDGSTDTLVANGSLSGSLTVGGSAVAPSTCDIGDTTSVLDALITLQSTALTGTPSNGCNAGDGLTGDEAGVLVWDLPDLASGDSETFVITKDASQPVTPPPSEVPEPGTLALFGTATFGLAALRRRRRG